MPPPRDLHTVCTAKADSDLRQIDWRSEMRTKTKILTTVAAGTLAFGPFAAGAGADDGDTRQARHEMHAQLGGDLGAGLMCGASWEYTPALHDALAHPAMQQLHSVVVQSPPHELRAGAEPLHHPQT